jgi:hypothetical protein
MNPHYQYFLATGAYGSTGKGDKPAGDDIISPPPPPTPLTEVADPYTPTSESAKEPSKPKDPPSEYIEPITPSQEAKEPSVVPTETIAVTTIGDTQLKQPTTTINIFGQGTLTGSLSDQISVDPDGTITTSTSDPNAAPLPSGGGGGGFGLPSGAKKPKKTALKPKKKSWIPLIAIAAGAALIILKPLK